MPSLVNKLTDFARSGKGKEAIAKAREQAAKPENRERLNKLRAKITKKP
jgi:hypothetical protein